MATRPIFIPSDERGFVRSVSTEFMWHAGFALSQKQRSIESLHRAAGEKFGLKNILEISSRSTDDLGRQLSAFRLSVSTERHGRISVESAFQGSKVFGAFGPCNDLYSYDPKSAKATARERDKNDLEAFHFDDVLWPLEPKTAFYDWLYLTALSGIPESSLDLLASYDGFSDIEFNPIRSFNCQARSCALAIALRRQGLFNKAIRDRETFIRIVWSGSDSRRDVLEGGATDPVQKGLFD